MLALAATREACTTQNLRRGAIAGGWDAPDAIVSCPHGRPRALTIKRGAPRVAPTATLGRVQQGSLFGT